MAIRKSNDLENESDSRYNNVKTSKAREKITERFDDTSHNEQISDEALQSANTSKAGTTSTARSRIVANHSKVGITSTQASHITANNAKVTYDKNLSATEEITLKATVLNSRGTYTLRFEMTHGETTKTATLALK